jgi:hypothetical protein
VASLRDNIQGALDAYDPLLPSEKIARGTALASAIELLRQCRAVFDAIERAGATIDPGQKVFDPGHKVFDPGHKVFVLTEHEPASEYPIVVVGVYATIDAAQAVEATRRAKASEEGKLTWPENDGDWEVEWTIDAEVVQ